MEPATAVTVTADGLTLSSAVALMFSVTGKVSGGLVEPGTETVTVPLQVCAVVNPVVFTLRTSWVC